MLLIARFYEKFSGKRTYYQAYIVPLVLFGGACARYSSQDALSNDVLGNLLLLVGGGVLSVLCLYLGRTMLSEQQEPVG